MTIPNWYDLCFKFCKTLCHDYCCEEDLLFSRNISQTGLKFYVIKCGLLSLHSQVFAK